MTNKMMIPVFLQFLLTILLLLRLAYLRVTSIQKRETKIKDIVLGQNNWPATIMKVDRNFHNQLELPFFFYIVVIFFYVFQKEDTLSLTLAYLFVGFRFLHSLEHITVNHITRRFAFFLLGAISLILLWGRLFLLLTF